MTTPADHLTALKFNVVAKSPTRTRWVSGRLGCTLDCAPDGWTIGAEGKTTFGQSWETVLETINRLSE